MSPAAAIRWQPAAVGALMVVLMTGCQGGQEQQSEPTAATSASTGTSGTSQEDSDSSAASPRSSVSGQAQTGASAGTAQNGPAALPSTNLPDRANLSVFRAEITQARRGEVRHPAGHEVPGTPGVVVSVRLHNLSANPVDAAYLSSPTALVNGEQVAGVGDAEDPADAVFGTIGAGEEQTVDFVFPTQKTPARISVHLSDPVSPETAVDLEHEVAGGA